MQAIEFETQISKQGILLPLKYEYLYNKKARVIILYSEDYNEIHSNYNKLALKQAIQYAKEKNVFSKIKNSIEWQKKVRDEWE